MKHTLRIILLLLCCMKLQAQTTEGTDFWVTFLQADEIGANPGPELNGLTLTFSSKKDCQVSISNDYSGKVNVVQLTAGNIMSYTCDSSTCYVKKSLTSQYKALHITSTDTISIFAGNYRNKSFDASIVLPTTALGTEYYVQNYPASDHTTPDNGGPLNRGTHFAIVATENATDIEFTPTTAVWNSQTNTWQAANQINHVELQAGQVYYVWSGATEQDASDLSGTHIVANKPIAVFCGAPHTNIPNKVRDRDHLYEQAMPVKYWGTQFVVTGSMLKNENGTNTKRKHDYVRITARDWGTTIWKNGTEIATITPEKHPKRTLTIPISDGEACYLTSSCPIEVFLYMTSNHDDDPSGLTNGDPAMVWINPIEQQLSEITFISYLVHGQETAEPQHFVNIVTDATTAKYIEFDGVNISSEFKPLAAEPKYAFTQHFINHSTIAEQHHIKATNGGGFIAHAYGFGEKESYAYSAGGATKNLSESIMINGEEFTPNTENQICGKDNITFTCQPNYPYKNIQWIFGDGTDTIGTDSTIEIVNHYYKENGIYNAQVVIERLSTNQCQGQAEKNIIPIRVSIGKMQLTIDSIENPICAEKGNFKLYYSNPMNAHIYLTEWNITTEEQNEYLKEKYNAPFTDSYFLFEGIDKLVSARKYDLLLTIYSNDCGNDTIKQSFIVNYNATKNIVQRGKNILGVLNSSLNENLERFEAFQWYRNGEKLEGETRSVLNLNDQYDFESEYTVCLVREGGDTLCSCPVKFIDKDFYLEFEDKIRIGSTTIVVGEQLYITTREKGEYTWYDMQGKKALNGTIPAGGSIINSPDKKGLWLLEIRAENRRTFRVLVH